MQSSKLDRFDMNDKTRPKISRWRSLFGKKPLADIDQGYSPLTQLGSPDSSLTLEEYWSGWPSANKSALSPPVPEKDDKIRMGVQRAATLPVMTSARSPMSSPLLDVEIPSVQMERFSVMFNGLLPHQRHSRYPSNLLARRQANVEKSSSLRVFIASH